MRNGVEQFYVEVLTGTIFDAVKSADKRADEANWFGREKLVFLRTNKIATYKSHRLVTAYFLGIAARVVCSRFFLFSLVFLVLLLTSADDVFEKKLINLSFKQFHGRISHFRQQIYTKNHIFGQFSERKFTFSDNFLHMPKILAEIAESAETSSGVFQKKPRKQ